MHAFLTPIFIILIYCDILLLFRCDGAVNFSFVFAIADESAAQHNAYNKTTIKIHCILSTTMGLGSVSIYVLPMNTHIYRLGRKNDRIQ